MALDIVNSKIKTFFYKGFKYYKANSFLENNVI